jgi:hypothetical protein
MKSQIYYINSRNRLQGTDNDFSINLNLDSNNTYNRIAVLDISIPKSMYNINQYNNTFIVSENGVERTITLPVSNYNRKNFVTILLPLLNTGSWVYAISYSQSTAPDTGKYIFSVSNNAGVQPIFIFGVESLFEIMGFNRDSSNSFTGDSLTSTNIINFNTENSFYLHSDSCQDKNNILYNIYTGLTENQSYIINHNDNPLINCKTFVSNYSNIWRFWLSNEDDMSIDLNGLNFNFTILLFEENISDELIINYIKYKTLQS